MRYDDHHPARTDPPRDPSPVAKALTAVCVLAVGVWLLANPLAGAAVLVALAVVVLLVGVPLAVVRGVVVADARLARRKDDRPEATTRVTPGSDTEATETGDTAVAAE